MEVQVQGQVEEKSFRREQEGGNCKKEGWTLDRRAGQLEVMPKIMNESWGVIVGYPFYNHDKKGTNAI